MRDNLVSVIMPCFNSENFIEQAIQSVLNQTYQSWELLICDDNSNDDSKNIIKAYEQRESRIKLVNNKFSKGVSGARNSCLEVAKGQFIAFLDSDDQWYSEKLTQQINFMTSNGYSFCFSYYDVTNEKGMFLKQYLAPKVVNRKNILFQNYIGCLTAIYDAKVLGKFYQPNIKKRNDYALWLKILHSNHVSEAYCLEKVTASYRSNQYGLSSSNRFVLLHYYWICLTDFASVNRVYATFLCIPYLLIMLVKKSSPTLYNNLVKRL